MTNVKRLFLLVVIICLGQVAIAQERQVALYGIGFYNLENLFDITHDEGKNDYEYLPDGDNHWNAMKYENKLKNMSRALADMGTDRLKGIGCAIIGVSEVENAHCLTDLCAQEPLAARNMQFVHIEGPDSRGVDCALLYNPRFFTPAKVWLQPYVLKDTDARPTRGFLTVQGTLGGDSLTVIVCHWPSRFSGSPARVWAGEQVRAEKDSIISASPLMKVIVMGDLNDDPFDESLRSGLRARRKIEDVKPGDMYNPWWQILLDGRGTLSYQGGWNLFDQIIMTPNCIDPSDFDKKKGKSKGTIKYTTLCFVKAEIQRFEYLLQEEGRYKGTPKRTHASGVWLNGYSDHLPVVAYFAREL